MSGFFLKSLNAVPSASLSGENIKLISDLFFLIKYFDNLSVVPGITVLFNVTNAFFGAFLQI